MAIKERVSTVQKTQEQIGRLANEVVDFKNLFSNKTERGRLGEEYLEDIVKRLRYNGKATLQIPTHISKTVSRVDCFLTLGSADLSIPIDSKFSWENYKKMSETNDQTQKKQYAKDFAEDITNHITKVSQYINEGETAPVAYMFVGSSEGVLTQLLKVKETLYKKARAKKML